MLEQTTALFRTAIVGLLYNESSSQYQKILDQEEHRTFIITIEISVLFSLLFSEFTLVKSQKVVFLFYLKINWPSLLLKLTPKLYLQKIVPGRNHFYA